jgi:hypothetical protein
VTAPQPTKHVNPRYRHRRDRWYDPIHPGHHRPRSRTRSAGDRGAFAVDVQARPEGWCRRARTRGHRDDVHAQIDRLAAGTLLDTPGTSHEWSPESRVTFSVSPGYLFTAATPAFCAA